VEKVTGIGGVFFRARNPEALGLWYAEQLGIEQPPPTYEGDVWWQELGPTVWAPFDADTQYFGPPEHAWMINFRVHDLAAIVSQLQAAGATVEVDPEFYPNGRFARLTDPESNPIQLWQPWGRSTGDDVSPEIDLFFRHVERFNAGVRSGDFGPMLEQFADGAELVFEGVPAGPFEGKAAISAAYATQPPDDEVLLLDQPVLTAGTVRVPYGWRADRGAPAGEMHVTVDGALITRLVVTFG
jgi:glyoxylase I family protein